MAETIEFYRTSDEYGCFSNFARYPIAMEDGEWPTTEHWFQAQKFVGQEGGEEWREAIRRTRGAMDAARMGRDRSKPRRPEWDQVRLDCMRRAVLAKFTQHDDLRAILLGTGDARIVEHTANDSEWGDGGDGSGLNWLGKILMEVREQLAKG